MLFDDLGLWLSDSGRGLRVTGVHSEPEGQRHTTIHFEALQSFRLLHWECHLEAEAAEISMGGSSVAAGPAVWSVTADDIGTIYVHADAFTSESSVQ